MRAPASRSARPRRSMFARVRGWTGHTSGRRAPIWRRRSSSSETRGIVDVRGPVHRDDAEAARLHERLCRHAFARQRFQRRHRLLQRGLQRVDHEVADEMDALGGDALARQVVVRGPLGGVEQVGDLVRHEPVDLFGHAAVEAAQAGLDMHHRHMELRRDEGAGHGGVDVADDDHRRGPVLQHHRLEALHDLCRLDRVRARADFQVDVGRRQFEVGEQAVVQREVVVLSGVDQHGPRQPALRLEGAQQRCHLHVVGPGAHDAEERAGIGCDIHAKELP